MTLRKKECLAAELFALVLEDPPSRDENSKEYVVQERFSGISTESVVQLSANDVDKKEREFGHVYCTNIGLGTTVIFERGKDFQMFINQEDAALNVYAYPKEYVTPQKVKNSSSERKKGDFGSDFDPRSPIRVCKVKGMSKSYLRNILR